MLSSGSLGYLFFFAIVGLLCTGLKSSQASFEPKLWQRIVFVIWVLVFCPGNSLTKSSEFLEDRVGRGGPHERARICVVITDEAVDFFDEVGGGFERATTNSALSDESEESFDQVEPGGVGRREVKVPARAAGEPGSDFGMLVGGIVVDDEMDVELGRHIGLDVTQEGEELLMAMAGFALGDDRAVQHVEGGKQGGRSVALVVVGDAFDVAEPHRKHRLG